MYRLELNANRRPRLLLAYADSAHAVPCGRYFRRLGWEVRMVASAAEAQRLVAVFNPRVIVLDTELADESGWLACAKIMLEHPGQKVILIAPERTPDTLQQLETVKAAALFTRQERVETLGEFILGKRLAEAV